MTNSPSRALSLEDAAKRHESFLLKHFAKRRADYATPHEIMDWKKDSQIKRFQPLVEQLRRLDGDFRLLDLGCGNCQLYSHLSIIFGDRFEYIGIDPLSIYDPSYEQSANFHFKEGAALAFLSQSQEPFDAVYISGLFNETSPDADGFSQHVINIAFQRCLKFICYNKFTNIVDFYAKNLQYYNLTDEIRYIVGKLSPRFAVAHRSYGLHEATFTVYK